MGGSRRYRKQQSQKANKVQQRIHREKKNAPPCPTSTQLGETSTACRKGQRHTNSQSRQDSFNEAERMLNDRRNRITTPTLEEDDDEITRLATEFQSRTRKYKRRSPSVVWNHVPPCRHGRRPSRRQSDGNAKSSFISQQSLSLLNVFSL